MKIRERNRERETNKQCSELAYAIKMNLWTMNFVGERRAGRETEKKLDFISSTTQEGVHI